MLLQIEGCEDDPQISIDDLLILNGLNQTECRNNELIGFISQ